MKQIIYFLFFFLQFYFSFSQNGIVVYKFVPPSDATFQMIKKKSFGNNPSRIQQRAFLQMKNMLTKAAQNNYILKFNNDWSFFTIDLGLSDDYDNGNVLKYGLFSSRNYYYNFRNNKLYSFERGWGKTFFIEESKQTEWKVTNETKKIGKYTVYKAIRNELGNRGIKIAWFAPEIPVSVGPLDSYGLPGLILQYYLKNGNSGYFIATKINIKKNPVKIKVPEADKKLTREEYNKISKEMRNKMKKFY